ncbi:MAG: hypothetical protein KatS3mg108_1009 [Isosphaeraceae bacterium]|jgi:hypothetical protein|nr:MAG: hypothetical protein KatS3mg108_1009 [Isosphaeraceae bacterium]
MGWKTINGRRYYYKCRRVGGRVVTEYYGGGEAGAVMAHLQRLDNLDRAEARDDERARRQEDRDLDDALDALVAEARSQADALIEAAGYYRHRRQWRRRHRSGHPTGPTT